MWKIIAVFFLSLLTFSDVAVAGPVWTSGEIEFAPIQHVVLKGEVLSRIAKHFAVPMKLILLSRFNPVLAERNNPNLIYAGEKIVIPLPAVSKPVVAESKGLSEAMIQSKVIPSTKVTSVPRVNLSVMPAPLETLSGITGLSNRQLIAVGFWVSAFLAAMCLYLGVSLLKRKPEAEVTHDEPRKEEEQAPPEEGLTPTAKIIEMLGTVRAGDLAVAMKVPIAADERGNPVLLGNIASFMQNEARRKFRSSLVKDLSQDLSLGRTRANIQQVASA